jgi:tRNA nucleotidyltransferase (CCA-adding enzyme)
MISRLNTNKFIAAFCENMDIITASNEVLLRLEENGFDAYRVGGFVRDRLLQRPIHDIDIATNALPDQVMNLFEKVIPTGLKHGTVTVCYDSYKFEVTTFRAESSYKNFRRPIGIMFRQRIEDDLARRDFTVNAMAEALDGRTIDPYGGLKDLAQKQIRAVGNPYNRMQEDALRLMRAVRFTAELGFTVEKETERAIRGSSQLIEHVSTERIRDELSKMFTSRNPQQGIGWMERLHLWQHVFSYPIPTLPFPKLSSSLTVPYDSADTISSYPAPVPLCWAVFLRWVGLSPMVAEREMARFRHPKEVIRGTKLLLELWDRWDRWLATKPTKEDWIRLMLEEDFYDIMGSLNAYLIVNPEARIWVNERCQQIKELHKGMPITSIDQLAVNGHDIVKTMDRSPGKWVRNTLERIFWKVATGNLPNHRETLLEELMRDGGRNEE